MNILDFMLEVIVRTFLIMLACTVFGTLLFAAIYVAHHVVLTGTSVIGVIAFGSMVCAVMAFISVLSELDE
jgi:hypothetical protein